MGYYDTIAHLCEFSKHGYGSCHIIKITHKINYRIVIIEAT